MEVGMVHPSLHTSRRNTKVRVLSAEERRYIKELGSVCHEVALTNVAAVAETGLALMHHAPKELKRISKSKL